MLSWTILEDQFPVPRNTAASKIGDGLISLLWQLRSHFNPDHNKVSSLSNTTVVAIFRNLCLWRRHAQTWEVLTLKNPIEPPKVHQFSLSLHSVATNRAKFKHLFFKQYKAWFSFSCLYFLQCWLRDQTKVQRAANLWKVKLPACWPHDMYQRRKRGVRGGGGGIQITLRTVKTEDRRNLWNQFLAYSRTKEVQVTNSEHNEKRMIAEAWMRIHVNPQKSKTLNLSVREKREKNREEREGKGWEPVDKHLGPSFHGTRCASGPDASSSWREHWLLIGLIYTGFWSVRRHDLI